MKERGEAPCSPMPQIRTFENSLGKKGSLRTFLDQILDNILQLIFLHLQTHR